MTFKQIHAARIISNIYQMLASDAVEMSRLRTGAENGNIQVNKAKREILAIWKHFKRYSIIFRDIEEKYFPKAYKTQGNYKFIEDIRNVEGLRLTVCDIIVKATK